jgi:hypothetical protein
VRLASDPRGALPAKYLMARPMAFLTHDYLVQTAVAQGPYIGPCMVGNRTDLLQEPRATAQRRT